MQMSPINAVFIQRRAEASPFLLSPKQPSDEAISGSSGLGLSAPDHYLPPDSDLDDSHLDVRGSAQTARPLLIGEWMLRQTNLAKWMVVGYERNAPVRWSPASQAARLSKLRCTVSPATGNDQSLID